MHAGQLKELLEETPLEELGLYVGIYPATVAMNTDPLGMGRIRGSCPVVSAKVLQWGEVYGQAWGAAEGASIVPEMASNVGVGFYGGKIEHPYYMLRGFNALIKPTSLPVSTRRILESKLVKIEMLDDSATFRVSLKLTGQQLEITALGFANLVANIVNLGTKTLLPIDGVITGQSIDPFTKLPHVDYSLHVRAKKI